MRVRQDEGELVFDVFKVPELTSLVSHIDERSVLSHFKNLLFNYRFCLSSRTIYSQHIRQIHFDRDAIDVSPDLGAVVDRSCPTTFVIGSLLLFVLIVSLAEDSDVVVNQVLHLLGN